MGPRVSPKMASWSAQPFLRRSLACPTHTHTTQTTLRVICSKRPHLCTSICCHYAPFSDNSCQTIVYCEFTMLCTHRLSTFSLRLSNSFSRHRPRCSQPPPVRTHWSPGDRQSWPKNGIFVAPTPKCDAQNRNRIATTQLRPAGNISCSHASDLRSIYIITSCPGISSSSIGPSK